MNVARAKLDLIKPEEVNMDEYEVSRDFIYLHRIVKICSGDHVMFAYLQYWMFISSSTSLMT